ncbi:MAG: hypothetical protein ABSF18_00175 [Gammaproteobacteria bacterium]|jgi:hypothetical protein
MTITREQFQQQYGFMPKAAADVNELHDVMTGKVDANTKADIIGKYYPTSERWVRLFDDNNANQDPAFKRALVIDVLQSSAQALNLSNPQGLDANNPIVAKFNEFLPFWQAQAAVNPVLTLRDNTPRRMREDIKPRALNFDIASENTAPSPAVGQTIKF